MRHGSDRQPSRSAVELHRVRSLELELRDWSTVSTYTMPVTESTDWYTFAAGESSGSPTNACDPALRSTDTDTDRHRAAAVCP